MTIRNALLAIALSFGVWETTDIPDTGAIAAIFALLFFTCSVWLWRRNTRIPAIVLALQFTVEATQAHTWKDASTPAKDAAMVLGTAGIAVSLAYLARTLRPLRQTKGTASYQGGTVRRQRGRWPSLRCSRPL